MKNVFLCALLLLLVTATPALAAGKGSPAGRPGTVAGPTEADGKILLAINRIRVKYGLAQLKYSDKLGNIARAQSRDMAKSGILGHRDSGGHDLGSRIAAAEVKGWRIIGENVARSFGHPDNAETIVSVWMESEPHRKNILSGDFNFTGIGTALAEDGTLFATQVFMGASGSSPDASRHTSRKHETGN